MDVCGAIEGQRFEEKASGGYYFRRGRFPVEGQKRGMLLATFNLEHEAVALAEAFEEVSTMEVEAERIAAHSTKWTMPCLWVAHEDFAEVDDALAAAPSVKAIVESEEFDREKYYQVEWTDEVIDRVNTYIDKEGSIIQAEATADGWQVHIRFAHRNQFDTFRNSLSEQGHSFTLLDLTEPGSPRQSFGALTPDQRDALVAAHEAGYFKVPRETDIQELAEELDMSHQSLSELLRRGTDKLVSGMLTTAHGTE